MDEMNLMQVELSQFTRANSRGRPPVRVSSGPGVYGFYMGSQVVYIGMSSDLARRTQQHWYPRSAVGFFCCDESSARWIEKRLIAKHRPVFNTKGV